MLEQFDHSEIAACCATLLTDARVLAGMYSYSSLLSETVAYDAIT